MSLTRKAPSLKGGCISKRGMHNEWGLSLDDQVSIIDSAFEELLQTVADRLG